MSNYRSLDFDAVKEKIAAYASFSLSKDSILNKEPNFNKLVLRKELALMQEALSFINSYPRLSIGQIADLTPHLAKVEKGMSLDTYGLKQCAYQSVVVKELSDAYAETSYDGLYLSELVTSLASFEKVQKEIDRCIDDEYQVNDNATPNLLRITREISGLKRSVDNQIKALATQYSDHLMEKLPIMRSDRYTLLVKISSKNLVKGIIHGESASGQAVYIEPFGILETNNQLQGLLVEKQQEIERILKSLSQQLRPLVPLLRANLKTITILDESFAKAQYGVDNNGCVARINFEGNDLIIKEARHPLINPEEVVANDYILENKKALLISGPNTGGKTVTLKTIGVFILLSYSGFPILASEASLPYFDKIFLAIGDEQSIENSLSTFSSHLVQLAKILENCTSQSLVLLDELGSGTDPLEGEALAMAILEYLLSRNAFVVATTHYAKLKNYGTNQAQMMVGCVEFDLTLLKPTYKFLPNTTGQSNALDIANRYGIPQSVIKQAKEFKESNKSLADKKIEELDRLVYENQQREQAIIAESEQLAIQLAEAKNHQLAAQRQKDLIIKQAKEDALKLFESAKEEANVILSDLKDSDEAKLHERLKLKEQLNKDDSYLETEQVSDESFKVGDHILFKKYNTYGQIVELRGKRATILVNGLKTQTTTDQLAKSQKVVQKVKKDKGRISENFNRAFPLELNLLGYRVDEALAMVDKYLDNALLAKVSKVRIVHGVGTGALRTAVQSYLKTNKLVKNYYYGLQSEGGLGATIVELKGKKK